MSTVVDAPVRFAPAVESSAGAVRGYRADIDGLRAVSILLVVGYHAGLAGLPGGYVGVDVFFVLSGYLITGLLIAERNRTGRVALGEFYARRLRRLLPLASLVLVATLLAGMWLLPPLAREGLVGDARAAAFYVANWRFAGQATAYSDTEVTDSLLVHYWSLSIEEQFYLLWPALIIGVGWIVGRRRPSWELPALGGLIAALVSASFAASVLLTDRLGPTAYFLTHTRMWEMGVGAVLALVVPRLNRIPRWLAQLGSVGGVVAVGVAAVRFDASTAFPGWAALLPVLGAAVLVASAAHGSTSVSGLLSRRPLPMLGRWSYAWYLWHWPVIGIGLLLDRRYDWPLSAGVVTALAVVVSLGLAVASHVLVENPVRYHRALARAPRRNLAFGASLMVLPLLLGAVAVRTLPVGDVAVAAASPASAAMTPRQAAEDRPSIGRADECMATITELDVAEGCVFGEAASATTVVLIGDSHAQHWLPALHEAGLERGWRVLAWTKSACPPVDVAIWSYRLERPYRECDIWRAGVLHRLRSAAPVDLVVLAASKGYTGLVLDDEGERVPRTSFEPYWSAAASRTYSELLGLARRVVRLHDTPWAPHDVPACLAEAAADPHACGFDRTGAVGLDEPLLRAERWGAPAEVEFVDLNDLVCPDSFCEVVTIDGIIKFRDQHHLTQTFARELGHEIGEALDLLVDEAG